MMYNKFYSNDFYVKTEFIPFFLNHFFWIVFLEKCLTIQFCFDFLQFAYSHHWLKEKFKQKRKKLNFWLGSFGTVSSLTLKERKKATEDPKGMYK